MSLDVSLLTDPEDLTADPLHEARRQVGICNACRYCEGYCAVFPAITRQKTFASGDLTQLANLCHNCRGCYYACQYTPPHAFAVNLPRALAEVRAESWERFAWPGALGGLFQRSGAALAAALVAGFAVLFLAIQALPGGGEGFYTHLGHSAMVAIFAPAFLLPLAAMAMSLRAYWREVGGTRVAWPDLRDAALSAGRLKNLSAGRGRAATTRRATASRTRGGGCTSSCSTGSSSVSPRRPLARSCTTASASRRLMDPSPCPSSSACRAASRWSWAPSDSSGSRQRWTPSSASPTPAAGRRGHGAPGLHRLVGPRALRRHRYGRGAGPAGAPSRRGPRVLPAHPYSKMAHGFYRFAALVRDAQTRRAHGA